MKRELVKSFRTVALLAMFSEDSTTANNISSCLKWLSLMEPDLILYPILERAVPSLEALVEASALCDNDNKRSQNSESRHNVLLP
jgi:proteasome activator subunit 4